MKLRALCKSKIHHAIVTQAKLEYIGSIGIDQDLMERADIVPGEKVHVWNVSNGSRIETYALPLPAGEGQIIINGAAARLVREGDKLIIAAFVLTDERVTPRMLLVDGRNRFVRWIGDHPSGDGSFTVDMTRPADELP